MNKRQFLQVLPLAAMTVTTLKVDGVEAQAHELKPEKKYLIVVAGAQEPEAMRAFADTVRGRLGPNVVVVAGDGAESLRVYELQ